MMFPVKSTSVGDPRPMGIPENTHKIKLILTEQDMCVYVCIYVCMYICTYTHIDMCM